MYWALQLEGNAVKSYNASILQNLFSAAIELQAAQDRFNEVKMYLINDTDLDNGLITLIARYFELQIGCNGCPSAASAGTYARAILSINADTERLSGAPIADWELQGALHTVAHYLKTQEGNTTL